MYICYVDEAGDVGQFYSNKKDSQPAFLLVGLILPQSNLRAYTQEFIALKKQYFPGTCDSEQLGAILTELKGSELRKVFVKGNQNKKRHTTAFLKNFVELVRKHDGKIVGKAHIKKPDSKSDPAAIYISSLQSVCNVFQNFLDEKDSIGSVVCDSRDFNQNSQSSHGIFTQMYKRGGDAYPRISDMPTFGDSRNHAGIQSADLIASALLFPMAMHAFCLDMGLQNIHVQPRYFEVRKIFFSRLGCLQYRYTKDDKREGGVAVRDRLGRQWGAKLFLDPRRDKAKK